MQPNLTVPWMERDLVAGRALKTSELYILLSAVYTPRRWGSCPKIWLQFIAFTWIDEWFYSISRLFSQQIAMLKNLLLALSSLAFAVPSTVSHEAVPDAFGGMGRLSASFEPRRYDTALS